MNPYPPNFNPLSTQSPDPIRKRQANVGLYLPNTLRIPCDPRPDPSRWFCPESDYRKLRPRSLGDNDSNDPPINQPQPGNEVTYLIDGLQTFASIAKAIQTTYDYRTGWDSSDVMPQRFIYIIGWWMTDDFPMIGNDPKTTLHSMFQVADDRGVQIRVMLWWQWKQGDGFFPNQGEIERVNDHLVNGAGIRDDRHPLWVGGAHHQKIVVVNGSEGLIGFCGGLDLNPDRRYALNEGHNTKGDRTEGAPLHDVHCRIRGPAAYDLLKTFIDRWEDHPECQKLEGTTKTVKGQKTTVISLVGKRLFRPNPLPAPEPNESRQVVQIGRTFANAPAHGGLGVERIAALTPLLAGYVKYNRPEAVSLFEVPASVFPDIVTDNVIPYQGYQFAKHGERTVMAMILHAIRQARRFIYIEDQYLVEPNVARAVAEVLPRLQHVTMLVPHDSITPMKPPLEMFTDQCRQRRLGFIRELLKVDPDHKKFGVYVLKKPKEYHTYVHTKMFIMDDEYALIGSANCNRRSYTHDCEVIAGIADQPTPGASGFTFAHRLRIALWAEHLGMDNAAGYAELADGVASAVHWRTAAKDGSYLFPNARIAEYDIYGTAETGFDRTWDKIDPDGT